MAMVSGMIVTCTDGRYGGSIILSEDVPFYQAFSVPDDDEMPRPTASYPAPSHSLMFLCIGHILYLMMTIQYAETECVVHRVFDLSR